MAHPGPHPTSQLAAAFLTATCALLPFTTQANTRHFTYTYETSVLAPGSKEIEVSNTLRMGRDEYYSTLDHRLEFEVGVAHNVMTAWYLNLSNTSEASALPNDKSLNTTFSWGGFSNEWKWKLRDPVSDPVGIALYSELTYKTDGFDLEPKILFDKSFGNFLCAANFITEFEFASNSDETHLNEIAPDLVFGGSYQFSKSAFAGLEIRNHNAIVRNEADDQMEYKFSSLYAGPVINYSTPEWWVTLSIMPQLPALYKKDSSSLLVLDDGEKLNARLLFSFHI